MYDKVFRQLYQAYGPQNWWPGDSEFEVMTGAILTQNTSWTNVEKAILNLKTHDVLSPHSIVETPDEQLAEWLRPSGYFNIKANRLKNFCRWYLRQGGLIALNRLNTRELREALLQVNGIGMETADSILLYAFQRPVFVIDQYTRRLLQRLGCIRGDEPYDELRLMMETELGSDTQLFNEFHALIVTHAKAHCSKKPRCEGCMLLTFCTES